MEKWIIPGLAITLMLASIAYTAIAQHACPYDDDYKFVLKKSLIDYLKNPSNSQMDISEVKQMLNFYLSNANLQDADCSKGNINALVDKADSRIPDSTLTSLKTKNLNKCYACPDGAVCGEQNAKGQTCTCKDVDNDGKSEYCYLKPIIPPIPTCEICPDGTLCGEENYKKQTCKCKDTNKDGKYEYCQLKPTGPECVSEGGLVPVGPGQPQCCQGLQQKSRYSIKEGQCIAIPGSGVCTNCGNGICGLGEDQCNCPQDCPQTCVQRSGCCCKPGGDCQCKVRIPCPQGLWTTMDGCDSDCKPVLRCSSCAGEGEIVYGSTSFGPTACCSKNDGIKPSPILSGDICAVPNDGSVGTCTAGWWQTCPNGICGPGEDKCNCPKDCPERSCYSDVDCGSYVTSAAVPLKTFCEFPEGKCTGPGKCVQVDPNGACPALYQPVCGCDKKTYGNDCERTHAAVSKRNDGECESPPVPPCVVEGGTIGYAVSPQGMEEWEKYGKYLKCCEGLTKIDYTIRPDSTGTCRAVVGWSGSICTKCGDGQCGAGENKCNCPKDCPETCLSEGQKGPGGPIPIGAQTPECCAGLTKLKADYDSNCIQAVDGGYTCAYCGNGQCGPGENSCNCPQDCPQPPMTTTTLPQCPDQPTSLGTIPVTLMINSVSHLKVLVEEKNCEKTDKYGRKLTKIYVSIVEGQYSCRTGGVVWYENAKYLEVGKCYQIQLSDGDLGRTITSIPSLVTCPDCTRQPPVVTSTTITPGTIMATTVAPPATTPQECRSELDCIYKYGLCSSCNSAGRCFTPEQGNCQTNSDCTRTLGTNWECRKNYYNFGGKSCCSPKGCGDTTSDTSGVRGNCVGDSECVSNFGSGYTCHFINGDNTGTGKKCCYAPKPS